MKRRLFTLAAALSLLLCVATMVMWIRQAAFSSDVFFGAWRGQGVVIYSSFGEMQFLLLRPFPVDLFPEWRSSASKDGHAMGPRISFGGSPTRPWSLRAFGLWLYRGPRSVSVNPDGRLPLDAFDDPAEYNATSIPLCAWSLQIPFPHAVVVSALLPVAWVVKKWRARRIIALSASAACVACGYDLRGTPDRCPECGTVPAKATTL